MDNSDFPTIPQALILKLDELFPEACPSLKDTDREVWFKAGQRDTVRFLKARFEDQQNPSKDRS